MTQHQPLLTALAEPAPRGFYGGTYRTVAPAATVERVRPLMPAMGITRVANVTGLDHIGIPVVMVCRPNSRSLSVAQGKGLDLESARASGLMEAVESYHAERISLPLKLAGFEELRYDHRVVDLDSMPKLAEAHVHPRLPIHWIEGYDLLGQEFIWLPFDLVHLNYTLAMHRAMTGFAASSNGLASGNHLLEAICHGLFEVVERDAFALWRLGTPEVRATTRIDLDTVADPACRTLLERYERAGILVGAWEITSDIGIPAFVCTIIEREDNPLRRLGHAEGAGCHRDPAVALLRALSEAAQSRLTMIAGSRDDCYPSGYTRQRDADLATGARATIRRGAPGRPFNPIPLSPIEDLRDDLAWALGRLRAAGLNQVIVVDLTRPAIGLPVARVVIPGLEPIASGKLYLPGARAQARIGLRS